MSRKRMLDGTSKVNNKSKISKVVPKFKMYKQLYNKEYCFTRNVEVNQQISSSGNGFVGGVSYYQAFNIVFNSLSVSHYYSSVNFVNTPIPNVSEIAALWDLLRIDKVEVSVYLNHSRTSGSTAFVGPSPMLICNDPNGSQGGCSLSDIQQQDCKIIDPGTSIVKWTVYPKFQSIVYYTGATSTYSPKRGFINADTDTPHFGTKIGLINSNYNDDAFCTFSYKYFFTAKATK